MKILVNTTNNKKDVVKASNAVTPFKEVIGKPVKAIGFITYEKEELDERTGVMASRVVTCMKLENGDFISSISPTINNSIDSIVASYDVEEIEQGLDVIVKSKKSNGGRDFLYVDLV